MGGYASTPKKGKVSEEGGEGNIRYAASGMQGWRAGMEDAHIALLKVPKGCPPSAQEIGAARIWSSVPHSYNHSASQKYPLGDSSSPNVSNPHGGGDYFGQNTLGEITEGPPGEAGSRVRSSTYSAGDSEEEALGRPSIKEATLMEMDLEDGTTAKALLPGERFPSPWTGANKDAKTAKMAKKGGTDGEVGAGGERAGWKAVDLLEDAALFGVFDGHGGKAVADFCKERLPGLLAASPEIRAGDWKKGFPQVYHALDALLLSGEGQEKAGGWGGASKVDGVGVGCTIVTALLDRKRRQCYVAHAGDSRCVLCRSGRAVQLTRDHKPGIPTEYARIVMVEIWDRLTVRLSHLLVSPMLKGAGGHVSRVGRVNDNLNLSRAIGDMAYKMNRLRDPKDQIISAEPDVCRVVVTPGVDEFLLLACDGVWEMMNTTQVVKFVRAGLRAGNDPREVCESLLDACLSPDPKSTRYAGCDNMTVVLVLLEGWEAALATRAHPQSLTFNGGRLRSVEEAAAALSATLPKPPRRRESEPRPPLPAEFRAASQANHDAGFKTAVAPGEKKETLLNATVGTSTDPSDQQEQHQSSCAAKIENEDPKSTAANTAGIAGSEKPASRSSAPVIAGPRLMGQQGQQSNGSGATRVGIRRRSEADSAAILARRIRAEAANDWPPRRLSIGSGARPRPRTARGIEFSLASFSAPPVARQQGPRAQVARIARAVSTRRIDSGGVIAAATAGGARLKNTSYLMDNGNRGMPGSSPDSARRSAVHLRSATAPMLPSPLVHHRRRPSDEQTVTGAGVAASAEVGANGALAMAASEEKSAARAAATNAAMRGELAREAVG